MRERPLILVVDDEESFREIMRLKLASEGFDVIEAPGITEALQKAESDLPDLILMDMQMPEATGSDVALKLKENPKTASLPICFLTSMTDPWPGVSGDKKEISKELGMEDYLMKTDDLDKNIAKIKEIISRIPKNAGGFTPNQSVDPPSAPPPHPPAA